MTNDTHYAWAAGFIDGEGCVSVVSCTPKGMRRRQVQALLDVSQAHPEPLRELVAMFGGYVRCGGINKGSYYWRLYGRKAAVVLALVRPYLIVKRRQADLVLELVAMQGGAGQTRTDVVYNRALAITAELRILNYRGPRQAERLSESTSEGDPLRMVR